MDIPVDRAYAVMREAIAILWRGGLLLLGLNGMKHGLFDVGLERAA